MVNFAASAPKLRSSMIPPGVSHLDGFGIILGVELMDLRDVVHAIKAIEAILLTSIGEGGRGWNNWRIDVQRNPPVSSCSSDADLVVESTCCEALTSLAADLSAQSNRQQTHGTTIVSPLTIDGICVRRLKSPLSAEPT